jgi:MYXO-CTERM domain-containing protein
MKIDMRARTALAPSTLLWLLGLGVIAVPSDAHALDPFTNSSDLLNNQLLTSGVAMGVADMNNDGLDDIVRLDDGNILEIEYQQADGSFTWLDWGVVGGNSWGLALGDVNADGNLDVFTGGAYNGLKILTANATGDDYTSSTIGGMGSSIFTQCAAFVDIDANSTLDLFVCHDDGLSSPFNNDGTGEFTYDLGLIAAFASGEPPGSGEPHSGNYGIIWLDYDRDGDVDMYLSKCRLAAPGNPTDPRRMNILYENNGDGTWTEVAEERGLRPYGQSWSADFGDIDNDGDFDAIVLNHDISSVLYENDGSQNFSNITAAAGILGDLDSLGTGIQVHMEDFDNDGWIDILATGASGQHRLFFNQGDGTFANDAAAFDTGGPGIQSAVVGDLNSDGFVDVLAGFANGYNQPSGNPDRLFLNPGNDNNWLNIHLQGVESNLSGISATVEVNGAWGTQLRTIRGGESYGITNALTAHFGFGTADAIDSIVVYWPSGQVDTAMNPSSLNESVTIVEGCPELWYEDADGDGYGNPDSTMEGCLPPVGYVPDNTDCADDDETSFPGNPEVCDGADNNCDGTIDEGFEEVCGGGGSDTGGATTGGPATSGADGTASGVTAATDPTTPVGDESSGGDAGAADGGDGGCGCSTTEPNRGAWLMLSLFGFVAMGRRRRR